MKTIGVLLTNTGTPDAATPQAVRRYLREFLSDKRIVQLPHLVWKPILYGLVLTIRPKKSAALYKNIWMPDGSPMRVYMDKIAAALTHKLPPHIHLEVGMNYGSPSISDGVKKLLQRKVEKIIVLPLFPQFSDTTTSSSFDRVSRALAAQKTNTPIESIRDYAEDTGYIHALASSIHQHWSSHGRAQHLLISFHGIPERFVKKGDPYPSRCEATAHLLAQALDLPADKWTLCYQSQFGYDKWLKPATVDLLKKLPQQGIKNIDIICPGFSVDCLETLEEIAIRYQEVFHQTGGQQLHYIPALNDRPEQIDMLAGLILHSV